MEPSIMCDFKPGGEFYVSETIWFAATGESPDSPVDGYFHTAGRLPLISGGWRKTG
jgi:hypothetical protein